MFEFRLDLRVFVFVACGTRRFSVRLREVFSVVGGFVFVYLLEVWGYEKRSRLGRKILEWSYRVRRFSFILK